MGAGLLESKHARRAEDRDRFDAQARAWQAFRDAQRAGEDDASSLSAALDVYHHNLALAAVRRLTRPSR